MEVVIDYLAVSAALVASEKEGVWWPSSFNMELADHFVGRRRRSVI